MSKMMRLLVAFALVMGFVGAFWIIAPNMPHVLAQGTTTGEWKASLTEDNSKVKLSLERRTDRGGHNQMGQTYEFTDLQGLSRETALNGGPVRFSLVREAGRIDLEGAFQNGKGSGTFSFTGNPSFVAAMKSRGFDFEDRSNTRHDDDDRLFAATTLNVTTTLADDLNSLCFGKLNVDDLFKAAIFK